MGPCPAFFFFFFLCAILLNKQIGVPFKKKKKKKEIGVKHAFMHDSDSWQLIRNPKIEKIKNK